MEEEGLDNSKRGSSMCSDDETEDLSDTSCSHTNEDSSSTSEDDVEDTNENRFEDEEVDQYRIDGILDMAKVDFTKLGYEEMKLYHFKDLEAAYEFYNFYAHKRGFTARKWNVVKNKEGLRTQQTFVCFKEGYRLEKHLKKENPKREARPITRCGCYAYFRVRFCRDTGRWEVKKFKDEHTPKKFASMLPAHRTMNETDKMQMHTMRDAGIGVSQIYGLAAKQSGGYEMVGYRKRDMYNEIVKQRRLQVNDVRAAFSYLKGLRAIDSDMYWAHTLDGEGRLKHLFWCDGRSQSDYNIFGDVVAFDATYHRNKYMSPLVVFAGVNHHNQTIVFGSALVANETEETYVWLLKQFLCVMKGKIPVSVINDGDIAMRNAIKIVFPSSRHRLCAWHLLRNATSNVSNPRFTKKFRKFMLGDYEVACFRKKWDDLVAEFDLQGHSWVTELYEKRKMWATAHIRGNVFAGFRTTSRCEGLHSQVGRYVHYRNNLTEFLRHFTHYLSYTRQRELEADFDSIVGDPVLQTPFEDIERCVAKVYTRKIFFKFRTVLKRVSKYMVSGCERTPNCPIYIFCYRSYTGREWHVSYASQNLEVKCSCMRMESMGIPCEHILALLHYLDINELPESVVLQRWTKYAKHYGDSCEVEGTNMLGSMGKNRVMALLFDCYEMCRLAGKTVNNYESTRTLIRNHMLTLKEATMSDARGEGFDEDDEDFNVKDPARVRTKGCGSSQLPSGQRGRKRTNCCSVCQSRGHNKKTCPVRRSNEANGTGGATCSTQPVEG